MEARQRALARDLVEQHQPPAAGLLGAVHRGVGVADQVLDVLVRIGGERDADAGAEDIVSPCVQVERQAERRAARARPTAIGVLLVDDVLAQDRELVAAEARDRLVPAQRVAQALGDGDDQLVAGGVAEAVVDDLEAVEVEEQHGDVAAAAALEPLERLG